MATGFLGWWVEDPLKACGPLRSEVGTRVLAPSRLCVLGEAHSQLGHAWEGKMTHDPPEGLREL